MKKTILICLMVVLLAGSVLAAGPAPPHAFYGNVKYSNGTFVQEGVVIAKINSQQAGTSDIINGAYDLIVESNTEGARIYFYINNKRVGDYLFKAFEITKLDLVADEVEDDTDDSNGEDDSGGSSGGSGGSSNSGSSGSSTPKSLVLNPIERDDSEIVLDEQETETLNGGSSGITGGVIGAFGGGVIALGVVAVLILIVLAVVVVKRR